MKEIILVSACLLGINCKYNGGNNINKDLLNMGQDFLFIPICPEQLGGLPTPRKPCEIVNQQKIMTEDGEDKSAEYQKGAEESLQIAVLTGAKLAILKENSPSCGSQYIYDGTFSKVKIKGQGVCARLLRENGFRVISENEMNILLQKT